QPLYGEPIYSQGRIIGITRKNSSVGLGAEISLEPAAQLEISINPSSCLDRIRNTYDEFINVISPVLSEMNCELLCAGYHLKSRVDELSLIPKQRYEFMYNHFKTTGSRGKYMMKGTAATQVSVDYEDETDFSMKFRVANILSPIFSYLCDNADFFEGEPYSGKMLRTHIWNDVDPARSMIVSGACDGNFGFSEYAKYIYEMPPIFFDETYTGNKKTSELFANRELSPDEIEHITNMAFPDVRLKNRIEIRMADSMPIEKTMEFTALIKKIFYDKEILKNLYNETLQIKNRHIAEAKAELIDYGENAVVYGKPIKTWIADVDEHLIAEWN
ncbi:MAG: hypothetical protein LBI27_04015, partial [Clostridiales bacterium]|nr:hypothetical protein [Clostridiales bacterium]